MDNALYGSLKSFPLFDILSFLQLSKKTGTLSVEDEARQATLFFEAGALRFATTNQQHLRIGPILTSRKRLTPAQLQQIEALRALESEHFGKLAVQRGFITADELRDVLKIQVSEIAYDCLGWTDGRFRFDEEMILPGYAVTISVDLSNLIMEGSRRIDESEKCRQLLPDGDVVFRVAANPENQERINLSLEEWKVLFRIDGQKTLSELGEELLAELEPLALYKIVYGLLSSKLIQSTVRDVSLDSTYHQWPETPAEVSQTTQISGDDVALLNIDDEEWRKIEDDTRLLVSSWATLSFKDVVKLAVSVARLTVYEGGQVRENFALIEEEYTIGRLPENEISLQDSGASGKHARVTRASEGHYLHDLESRNGTYVNGARVQRLLLRDNDRILIGRTHLSYHIVYDVPAETASTRNA
ncbi:MAG TPA: DUF4388 domain-containing protein [Thermoanaerobaculia bacterium]|nr:DUF4388 domain-containing protein [Thermoanaerobaculia bacterium]